MSALDRQPDQTDYYTLDGNLRPQPCTKEEWLVWVQGSGTDHRSMAYTRIGPIFVETRFPGFIRAGGGDWFFETSGPRMLEGADTYEEAMLVHERMCETVRAEVAKVVDRQSTPNLD